MQLQLTVLVGVFAGLPALGCSSGDEGSPRNESGVLTDGDADACERDCDAQAAADCAKMPENYVSSCKSFCEALRQSTPDACQPLLRAQSQCALNRITYTCENDIARGAPQGACANEGANCAGCRGSLCMIGF